MKILLNLLAATAGGQVTRAAAFVDRFLKVAPDAHLLVLKPAGVMPSLVSRSRLEVVEIPIELGRTKAFRRMLWENVSLQSFVRRCKPDVFLTFSHYLPSRALGIPTIVAVSNLAPFSADAYNAEGFWGRLRLKALHRTILSSARRATCVIALSNACKQILVENRIPAEKIEVIPNGVAPGLAVLPDSAIVAGGGEGYILSVSNFYRYKNFEQLLRAYSQMSQRLRDAFSLKIIGNFFDMNYVAMLSALADRLGIAGRIEFVPGLARGELDLAYQKSSLFVFTSLIENCPNILLEAMAHGKPILSIDAYPMPEFGGDAVGYFSPGNDAQLARAMEALLDDQQALDRLSNLARVRSRQYSWEVFTEKVLDLCSRVREGRQGLLS